MGINGAYSISEDKIIYSGMVIQSGAGPLVQLYKSFKSQLFTMQILQVPTYLLSAELFYLKGLAQQPLWSSLDFISRIIQLQENYDQV